MADNLIALGTPFIYATRLPEVPARIRDGATDVMRLPFSFEDVARSIRDNLPQTFSDTMTLKNLLDFDQDQDCWFRGPPHAAITPSRASASAPSRPQDELVEILSR